jgi:hypothetical protein
MCPGFQNPKPGTVNKGQEMLLLHDVVDSEQLNKLNSNSNSEHVSVSYKIS